MTLRTALLTLAGAFVLSNSLLAQDPSTDLARNRAILRYYTGNDIADFETHDQTNLENLEYYFVRSFDVSLINCANCAINYTEFFNYDLFNIVAFENNRLQSSVVEFEFKNKYTVTLHSIDEVNANLANAEISEMTNLKADRPFPSWIDNGDFEADFNDYKKRVDEWAKDFPEEFRTMTSSGDMLTIRKEEFRTLRPYRRDNVFNHPGGYLITD